MCSYTRQRRKRQGGTSDAVFYQVVFGVPWAAASLETEYVESYWVIRKAKLERICRAKLFVQDTCLGLHR